ncbi:uncharacterized protein [Nicotiana tomentosiformis]|uniref:uncharacterized protein n=1 Tax=Nicotiana tomentosiformis TaxID=4098 RepID=UPI00388C4789
MVKRSRRWSPVKHLKKAKVEVRHPQKPRHLVTLEEFLPSWFRTKVSHEGIDASCCHTDKGEEKSEDLPSTPSSRKLAESIPQEVNACEEKVTFTNDDLLLGDTPHNHPLYLVGYMLDERVNRILVDGGSSMNILPIRTVKELSIPMNEVSESCVMIQGFNQGGQRAIYAIRMGITIEDMQSSAWLYVIDAKTLYNVLLGRPWIYENKVVPSTYHQCLKYYKGEVEKKIVTDDEPFTEAESHFTDAKFYLKNRIVKDLTTDDVMKIKNDEPTTKRAEVTASRAKDIVKEVQPNSNKSYRGDIASYGKKVTPALQYIPKRKKDEGESSNIQTNMLKELTLPIKQIEAVKFSSKPLAGFVAQNRLQNVAFPTNRTNEGFDPNAYRLFAKAGYISNEPSKLEKIPSEAATRKPREGLGYKQPSPVLISIRRPSSNYITVEDESAASNKPSIFDQLGKSTVRTSVFERLGPIKKENKFQRNYRNTRTPASPKIQKISKDFQSLVPSRIRRQTKVMVTCNEVLKVKPYTVVYTKERDEDEESVGSSYHVTAQGEHGVSSLMEDAEKLEDVSPCYHISFNDGNPQEDEDMKDAPQELEEEVKATINALKEVNLGIDEEPRPTYLSALLAIDEEITYIELLKEFKDVFAWSYKEMPGLDPKVAVHHLAISTMRVKDEFPLPIPELMIDAATGYEAMSFMDGSSGYNQIRMAPKDEELTTFRTPRVFITIRMMTPNELNYSPIEKLCLALVFSIQKLKHYFQAHVVRLVSKANPIKFVMSKPVFSDRLARWYLQFQQFEILYIPQKAVKGHALAYFLAVHPIPDDWELTDELPDKEVVDVQLP